MSLKRAFEDRCIIIELAAIKPLKAVSAAMLRSRKYQKIVKSIKVAGLVEPPVVVPDNRRQGRFLLLDGHLRVEALKALGQTAVLCLVATDDETFTYNSQVSRLAAIQEHRMILNAIEAGVSEARIAEALDVDVKNIRNKRSLLSGIDPEVACLLNDRQVPFQTIRALKKVKPARQIQVTKLMSAMNRFTVSYARSLVEATPDHLLSSKRRRRLRADQIAMMENETANLEREFEIIESDFGRDHLELVLIKGYLRRLLAGGPVVGHLARHYPEILREFQILVEPQNELPLRHRGLSERANGLIHEKSAGVMPFAKS